MNGCEVAEGGDEIGPDGGILVDGEVGKTEIEDGRAGPLVGT